MDVEQICPWSSCLTAPPALMNLSLLLEHFLKIFALSVSTKLQFFNKCKCKKLSCFYAHISEKCKSIHAFYLRLLTGKDNLSVKRWHKRNARSVFLSVFPIETDPKHVLPYSHLRRTCGQAWHTIRSLKEDWQRLQQGQKAAM